MNNDFLIQTSKDYDIDFDEVKKIYDNDYDKFYKNLEKYLDLRKHNE